MNKHRNNHNSGLIHQDNLIKTPSEIGLQKRRPMISHNHRPESSILLIIIRFIILLMLSLIIYYIFIYIYPKPKQNRWERVWYTIIDWLMDE